ncbi:uncharacterized protein LOC134060265 isoform X2 [Sardina pilchardus]|uniref:uncharacterized protein LOC134060265 isoform X2 n=1 Tax=Sardina pilchardus TaxID=27697 RepID=UPI002E13C74C
MAEDHASVGVKEYNAETLTDLLHDYVASVEELSHTNQMDDTSKHDAKEDDIGQIISHLLELGDDMKDSFPNETEISESWRNLGQTMESGLKLLKKLLEKRRPDPIQELGCSMAVTVNISINRKEKKALRKHKDEMDGRVKETKKKYLQKTSRESEETFFFTEHKHTLVERIGNLGPLLIALQRDGVLDDNERDEIDTQLTTIEKNQVLITKVEKKGKIAQKRFYHALKSSDLSLFQDLLDNQLICVH